MTPSSSTDFPKTGLLRRCFSCQRVYDSRPICHRAPATLSDSRWDQRGKKKHQNQCSGVSFNSTHSSSLSKPCAYMTPSATQPTTVWSEMQLCYVSSQPRILKAHLFLFHSPRPFSFLNLQGQHRRGQHLACERTRALSRQELANAKTRPNICLIFIRWP